MAVKKKPKQIIKPTELESQEPETHRSNQNPEEPLNSSSDANRPSTEHPLQSNRLTISANGQKNLELTQKVARLLSQEPSSTTPASNQLPFQSLANISFPSLPVPASINHSDLSSQISSLIDQKVRIFDEKLKLYQTQITQLRNELETKNQILDEVQKIHRSEAQELVEKQKLMAEARFSANTKLINAQAAELKENRTTIKELNEKISRIYSGEEERNRIKLQEENQELVQLNEQLKSNLEVQRRKRKEAERELGRANAVAQEAVKDQLKEANDEVETLKKMLEAETTNSKGLINQLNQLRSNGNYQNGSSNPQSNNNNRNNSNNNSSNNSNDKIVEDLKTRASIIGDFTGFEIINSSADIKGSIFDCIVTDIVSRGFALNFKLQFHSDNTCSYYPSLDEERDSSTIEILPEFLRSFIRFQKEASGHVFWKLFQAFNL